MVNMNSGNEPLPLKRPAGSHGDWRELHDEASRNRETFYIDPETGLAVFTEYGFAPARKLLRQRLPALPLRG